jgi:hypothetical protein
MLTVYICPLLHQVTPRPPWLTVFYPGSNQLCLYCPRIPYQTVTATLLHNMCLIYVPDGTCDNPQVPYTCQVGCAVPYMCPMGCATLHMNLIRAQWDVRHCTCTLYVPNGMCDTAQVPYTYPMGCATLHRYLIRAQWDVQH